MDLAIILNRNNAEWKKKKRKYIYYGILKVLFLHSKETRSTNKFFPLMRKWQPINECALEDLLKKFDP